MASATLAMMIFTWAACVVLLAYQEYGAASIPYLIALGAAALIAAATWGLISLFAPSEGRTRAPRGGSAHQYRAGVPSQKQHEVQIAKVRERIASGPADNRKASQRLADRLSNEDEKQAAQDFAEVTRRWAREAAMSGLAPARLKHAIEVAETACGRLLKDDLLFEDRAAQERVLATLRQITEEARLQLREIATHRLVDMSIDLDLVDRKLAACPAQKGSQHAL